jgi:hypothetical protein
MKGRAGGFVIGQDLDASSGIIAVPIGVTCVIAVACSVSAVVVPLHAKSVTSTILIAVPKRDSFSPLPYERSFTQFVISRDSFKPTIEQVYTKGFGCDSS